MKRLRKYVREQIRPGGGESVALWCAGYDGGYVEDVPLRWRVYLRVRRRIRRARM